jgi:hypothetical protein
MPEWESAAQYRFANCGRLELEVVDSGPVSKCRLTGPLLFHTAAATLALVEVDPGLHRNASPDESRMTPSPVERRSAEEPLATTADVGLLVHK